MITRNQLLFAILGVSLAFSTFAEVYRIVDEEGKVTFTDKPPHNAPTKEKISLPITNIQPALETAPTVEAIEEEIDGYQKITILTPTQDTTIPPGQETVTVQVGLKPDLQANHLIQLLLNGQPHGLPTATTSFNIGSLVRGENSIQVQVVDTEGNIIGLSNTTTIHIKRGSSQHPNNRPSPPAPAPH
ncbi:MAG: DUF4124 domain-containing protein [Porticoccus sp.]